MHPVIKDGDLLFCVKKFSFIKLKVNDIVLFTKDIFYVKMISAVKKDGLYVKGFCSFSVDSSVFGLVKEKEIQYKMLFKVNFWT